jgi:iron complex outermembrane receptor protein
MSTNSKLQSAIHLALGISAGVLAVSVVPNVFAQGIDAQDADAEEAIEEVIVTGSRIRRADIDSASPVTILTREDIMATGVTDVGSLIQSMPSMSGSPVGTTTNNGNAGVGLVSIDLRGMGPARTLTLINGKRPVDGGDYQAIPATMIERVEILKDGASAIYGADAVAGVVNIITRTNFEGIELTAQHADWFDSEGKQDSFGLISGTEFSGGNVVFGGEFVTQEQAYQSDTDWDFFQNALYIYPDSAIGCEAHPAAPYDGTGAGGCYPIGSSRIPESRLPFLNQGTFLIGLPNTTPYEVGLMEPHDGRTYNYAPVNYIQTPFERTNVFLEMNFDITDNIRFVADVRGNFRTSAQQLAPLPFSGTDPMWDGFYTDPATGETISVHGISDQNYYLRKAVDAYNAANGTSLIYEPVIGPRRRMIETNRRFEQTVTQYQWNAGLEGDFNDMNWDVFINEGYRNLTGQDFGQFAGSRLFNAMGPSADLDDNGVPECYADVNNPDTLIVGCVPINLFGGGEVDPVTSQPTVTTLTQDMVDYVSLDTVDVAKTRQRLAGASLTGSNFNLPAGEIGWAVGWSYWKQEYTYAPDSAKTIGAVTGNVGAGTEGSLTNNSFYGEVLVPVWDNGTQNIYFKGGLRYDDWNQFKGDTTYQLGLEFQAIESLKLRATYGTVFRAPTITDLFGGIVDSFPTYNDPCAPSAGESLAPGCDQEGLQLDTQVHALVGGNPNLIPETGDTLTAGFVWTPQFGDHGLTLTVDYWKINIEDGLSSLGVQFILDDCYYSLNQASCDLITRNDMTYAVDLILDGTLNVAEQGGQGVDTEIRWNYDSSIGQWQAALLWAHLTKRTKTAFSGAEEEELQGRSLRWTDEDGGTYAEDKVNISLQWLWHDLSLGYLGQYISGVDADVAYIDYVQDIDSQMYHDLFASYTFSGFGSNTTISGGITNIGDKAPPYIDIGFNASTDAQVYRVLGRGYYLRLAWKY